MSKSVEFANFSNEALLEEYDSLFRRYMYYMAAEGNWSQEAAERREVTSLYYACMRECEDRGLEISK